MFFNYQRLRTTVLDSTSETYKKYHCCILILFASFTFYSTTYHDSAKIFICLKTPKTRNSRLGTPMMVFLNSGLRQIPRPTVTLVGDNLDVFNSTLFLLCFERSSNGAKMRLVLHGRDKLTGLLIIERVLKVRSGEDEDDPTFSDRMEVGHIIAALPQSGKIVVAKGTSNHQKCKTVPQNDCDFLRNYPFSLCLESIFVCS